MRKRARAGENENNRGKSTLGRNNIYIMRRTRAEGGIRKKSAFCRLIRIREMSRRRVSRKNSVRQYCEILDDCWPIITRKSCKRNRARAWFNFNKKKKYIYVYIKAISAKRAFMNRLKLRKQWELKGIRGRKNDIRYVRKWVSERVATPKSSIVYDTVRGLSYTQK